MYNMYKVNDKITAFMTMVCNIPVCAVRFKLNKTLVSDTFGWMNKIASPQSIEFETDNPLYDHGLNQCHYRRNTPLMPGASQV